jgi:1-phosphatidylinositol-4-phosphate 5-kinase
LDFLEIHPEGISLEADTYNALIKTIERDCRVLESFKIMDYSLLLAIHNLDLAAKEEAKTLIQHSSIHFQNNESRSINRRKLVAHSTTMESIQMNGETIGKLENYVP